jgi:hypothetical protein
VKASAIDLSQFYSQWKRADAILWDAESRQKEVRKINNDPAYLIVAIVTAAIAFATLVLKIVEVSRKK